MPHVNIAYARYYMQNICAHHHFIFINHSWISDELYYVWDDTWTLCTACIFNGDKFSMNISAVIYYTMRANQCDLTKCNKTVNMCPKTDLFIPKIIASRRINVNDEEISEKRRMEDFFFFFSIKNKPLFFISFFL